MTQEPTGELYTVADVQRAARDVMSERAQAYVNGGAGDELTLRDNLDAWSRLALEPRMLTGAGRAPDLGITVLGRPRAHPIIVAPTAFAALAHPEAEPGIARAAAATSTTLCLSTLASTTPVALAQAVPEVARWFQLYVFSDRGLTRELVAAAEDNGYEALVLTADRPVLGIRERELRIGVRAGVDPDRAAISGAEPVDFSGRIDPSVTWADVERLAADSTLPVIVKGLLTPRDARLAAEHGAAGVVVSNHGGRQLDTTLSGVDALPEVVDAVGDRIDVLVDGGIRRGTDVVKALALGARAVMVGRPLLWGLSLDGTAGAQRVLELLLDELSTTLALVGAAGVTQLDSGYVRAAPWARP